MQASLIITVALGLSACTTYSSYQSAKLLPQGKTAYSGAIGTSSYSVDGNGSGEEILETQVRHGWKENMEVGARLSRLNFGSDGVFFLFVDGKLELIPERLSVALPVGLAILTGEFGDPDDPSDPSRINYYQAQPTLLYRIPVGKELDVEMTGKGIGIIAVADGDTDSDFLLAATLGVRFSEDLNKARWWIQPEFGIAINPGEDGYASHLGVAFTFVP